jgi:hypothetical protein
MIGANDSGTLLSLRERAVITLLAHLGLRAGEVIRLKLDDIDWLEGRLIIRSFDLGKIIGSEACPYLRKLGMPWCHTCGMHAPQLYTGSSFSAGVRLSTHCEVLSQ